MKAMQNAARQRVRDPLVSGIPYYNGLLYSLGLVTRILSARPIVNGRHIFWSDVKFSLKGKFLLFVDFSLFAA